MIRYSSGPSLGCILGAGDVVSDKTCPLVGIMVDGKGVVMGQAGAEPGAHLPEAVTSNALGLECPLLPLALNLTMSLGRGYSICRARQ